MPTDINSTADDSLPTSKNRSQLVWAGDGPYGSDPCGRIIGFLDACLVWGQEETIGAFSVLMSRSALPGDSRVNLFSNLRTAFDRETLDLTWRLLYLTGRHFPANYRDTVNDGKAAMQAR
jgi:hypothetical protein